MRRNLFVIKKNTHARSNIKIKLTIDQLPAILRGRARRYECDINHPGFLRVDWKMSVHSAIIAT